MTPEERERINQEAARLLSGLGTGRKIPVNRPEVTPQPERKRQVARLIGAFLGGRAIDAFNAWLLMLCLAILGVHVNFIESVAFWFASTILLRGYKAATDASLWRKK